MRSVILDVKDMHCVNCAMKLQSLEDDLPGVSSIEASYRKQKMTVVFNPAEVSLDKILEAIKNLGYTAEYIPS